MANPWFRLYAEFSHDPKVQMLSETDQRRLILLFCLRCNGHVTLQDEEVTFQLRISNDSWLATKAIFVAKGFINSDNEVLNWEKRQYTSDSSAARVAKHREKVKRPCNVTVTVQNRTDTEQIQIKEESKPLVGKPTKRRQQLPDDFLPAQPFDQIELQRFRDYHDAKGSVMADWQAAWRTWVSNAKKWAQPVRDLHMNRAAERAHVGDILTGRATNERNHNAERDITGESCRVP